MEQLMLLDITKLKSEVADVVVGEVQLDAKMRQAAIWAVERDKSIPHSEQVKTVKGLLAADMRFLLDLLNSEKGELGEHLHGAAHEMIDHCNEQARRDRDSGEHGGACKTHYIGPAIEMDVDKAIREDGAWAELHKGCKPV